MVTSEPGRVRLLAPLLSKTSRFFCLATPDILRVLAANSLQSTRTDEQLILKTNRIHLRASLANHASQLNPLEALRTVLSVSNGPS